MPTLIDHPGRAQPSVGERGAGRGELDGLVDDPLGHLGFHAAVVVEDGPDHSVALGAFE
ncbi:hypothetical protein [Streptomyces sp. S465]|uniref:hypothetical protein n=1 Tax=Streptomyces sp. S465 TaxID=2979468 RepID=UPI0022A82864|nr:hypothetical protein [Streptomyces sp. S465]WAP57820.1 hypothetical protein N6H00_24240 [Streptomyces sp. S465]